MIEPVVVRTDREAGGTRGLSALIVERGTPGVTYASISTSGQRLAPNCEIIFDNRYTLFSRIERSKTGAAETASAISESRRKRGLYREPEVVNIS